MKSFSTRQTIKKYLRFENNEIIIIEKNESHHEICLDFTIFFRIILVKNNFFDILSAININHFCTL